MKTRIHIKYMYGAWRVTIKNVGALYDIRRIHSDFLDTLAWCDVYNEYGYAPRASMDADIFAAARVRNNIPTYQD